LTFPRLARGMDNRGYMFQLHRIRALGAMERPRRRPKRTPLLAAGILTLVLTERHRDCRTVGGTVRDARPRSAAPTRSGAHRGSSGNGGPHTVQRTHSLPDAVLLAVSVSVCAGPDSDRCPRGRAHSDPAGGTGTIRTHDHESGRRKFHRRQHHRLRQPGSRLRDHAALVGK
jgi:hypothetical protein